MYEIIKWINCKMTKLLTYKITKITKLLNYETTKLSNLEILFRTSYWILPTK